MTLPSALPHNKRRACSVALALSWLAFALSSGCGRELEVGFDAVAGAAGTVGGANPGATGGAGAAGAPSEAPCVPTACRGKLYQCGNCHDDDGDGVADGLDADCLGPCDDDESDLGAGLTTPGAAPCRQDCYFDGDSGAGNDRCEWSHACDPLSVAPGYPPSGDARCAYEAQAKPMGVDCAALEQQQEPTCLDACLALVPNGCDCFGCCELPGRSGNFYFVGGAEGGGCQLDALDDAARCPPCTPVDSCRNECEECETCVGVSPDASCASPSACPSDSRACDATTPCDFGDYCVTGCCVRAPEPA